MFLSLPVELQQKIVDFIEPRDIIAFSSTCKQAHTISLKRLEENKFLAHFFWRKQLHLSPANVQFSAIETEWYGSPGLLVAIAETPRLALFLDDLDSEHAPWTVICTATPENACKSIKQLINASWIIRDDNEVHDWLEAVTNGRDGATLGLLLSRLIRLKKLQLDIRFRDLVTPYVGRAISRLAARSQNGFLDQGLSQLTDATLRFIDDSPADERPFSDDESSSILSSEDEERYREAVAIPEDHSQQVIRLLVSLTRLPNLRHLYLIKYKGQPETDWDDSNDRSYPLPTSPSQIQTLTVDGGEISAQDLSRIIEGCTNFSSFKYQVSHTPNVFGHYWENFPAEDPNPNMTLESVCAALLKHAKSSLRNLYIEMSEYGGICGCRHAPCLQLDDPWDRSINPCTPQTTNWRLNEFTNLERLSLDIDLFSNASGGWLPFAETLPVSIKEVSILGYRCPPGANKLDFENLLRGFKPQAFPKLRSINAWHRNRHRIVGPNGPDHILQIYSHMLCEADIPTDNIRKYELGDDYFEKLPLRLLNEPRWTNFNRIKEHHLYALPEKDLEGTVMFGVYHAVYHAVGTYLSNWKNLYTGLAVEKTWGLDCVPILK